MREHVTLNEKKVKKQLLGNKVLVSNEMGSVSSTLQNRRFRKKNNPNTMRLKCSQNATTLGDAGNGWVVMLPRRDGEGRSVLHTLSLNP